MSGLKTERANNYEPSEQDQAALDKLDQSSYVPIRDTAGFKRFESTESGDSIVVEVKKRI